MVDSQHWFVNEVDPKVTPFTAQHDSPATGACASMENVTHWNPKLPMSFPGLEKGVLPQSSRYPLVI